MTTAPTTTRQDFYQRLAEKNMAALWEALNGLVPREPAPNAVPAVWRYDELRDLCLEAGRMITAREAQRRVLVLENPGASGHLVHHAVALRRSKSACPSLPVEPSSEPSPPVPERLPPPLAELHRRAEVSLPLLSVHR